MENLAVYVFLASIVGLGVLALRFKHGPKNIDLRDPGEAILEFATAFPDEPIRSAIMNIDGSTTFMRLAGGKTGLVQKVGKHYVIRIIEPHSVEVDILPDSNGLSLDFEDGEMAGGVYYFKTIDDAAEVNLWIYGSFSQTLNDMTTGPVTKID